MITCPKCNKELKESAKFCDACGETIIFCPHCGEPNSSRLADCKKCGASLTEEAAISEACTEPVSEKRSIWKALTSKAGLVGKIGGIALVGILLVACMFLDGGSQKKYGLYLKDGEINYTDYSEKDALKITSHLLDDAGLRDEDLPYMGMGLGTCVNFSEDGNRIFFPDRMDDNAVGITLYYRDLDKPGEDRVKIDSDVLTYTINHAGTEVVYLKGTDKILYRSNLTEKEKIASGVVSLNVVDDCHKIGYRNDENNYYLWYADQDCVQLASNITSIEYMNDDLSVMYYMKDGSLYQQVEGSQDEKKIASDVSSVLAIYDSGEVYYTKEKFVQKNLSDYVEDDYAAADAACTFPKYETDQETSNLTQAEYDAACDAYWAKCSRDDMREQLHYATMENTEYTLCYFNGTEEKILTDALVDAWDVIVAQDKAVVVFPEYQPCEVKKAKLSEVRSSFEVEDMVNEALYSLTQTYLAIGGTMSVVDQTVAEDFTILSDGTAVYFLDDISEDENGNLYQMKITNGKVSTPKILDREVSDENMGWASGEQLVYYKNMSDDECRADLYINGEKIDEDVCPDNICFLEDAVMYYTDWSWEENYGTLMMHKNGTQTKIAQEVRDYVRTRDGDISYLYDFTANHDAGTLCLYHNGERKKIEDDVVALIPVENNIGKLVYYGWEYC